MRRLRLMFGVLALVLVASVMPAAAVLADDPAASTTTLAGPGPVQVGTDVVLTATVSAPDGYDADGATITFTSISGGGPDCTAVPVLIAGTECHLASLAVGTYVYEASYSGNPATLGSTSEPVTVEVTAIPDTMLDASNVTIDVSTFYPVTDSYRDKLRIFGTRNERITVSIRIYGPTGTRLLTTNLALGTGAYSYLWTGRDSHGSIRPAGRYKVVQVLRDVAGNTLVVTRYVNLSHKKLITKTKYVTKSGRSITAASVGNVFVSRSSGYAKLLGTSVTPAMAGYAFTIPSATVYKSITFQVLGTAPSSLPRSQIGLQDMIGCPDLGGAWIVDCFDHWRTWWGASAAWHAAGGSPTASHKGTRVRGIVYASHGSVIVRQVRIRVVYQVLG